MNRDVPLTNTCKSNTKEAYCLQKISVNSVTTSGNNPTFRCYNFSSLPLKFFAFKMFSTHVLLNVFAIGE